MEFRFRKVLYSPIAWLTTTAGLLLLIYAIWLLSNEAPLRHPRPALALLVVSLLVISAGLVFAWLWMKLEAADRYIVTALSMDAEHAVVEPMLTGLHHLVERLQTFPQKAASEQILDRQMQSLLSVALHNREFRRLRVLAFFSGTKVQGGAYLVQPATGVPLVFKYDRDENLARERERYESCVRVQLSQVAGEPHVPRQQYQMTDDCSWGFVTYKLIDGQGVSGLSTLASFVQMNSAENLHNALQLVFQAMRPWWEGQDVAQTCRNGYAETLYIEYSRLARKREAVLREIRAVGVRTGVEALANLSAETPHFELASIPLTNPIYWVAIQFEEKKLPARIHTHNRYDSIIHGDFHAGNVLISHSVSGKMAGTAQKAWVIDFPHTHVGPTISDLARLEADLLFRLSDESSLPGLGELVQWIDALLPRAETAPAPLSALLPAVDSHASALLIAPVRVEAKRYMTGDDARPYYLALLHATLPMVNYRELTDWQKQTAFAYAAVLSERISED